MEDEETPRLELVDWKHDRVGKDHYMQKYLLSLAGIRCL